MKVKIDHPSRNDKWTHWHDDLPPFIVEKENYCPITVWRGTCLPSSYSLFLLLAVFLLHESNIARDGFCFLQAFAFFTEERGGTDVEKKNLSEEEIVAKLMPDSLKAGVNNVDGFDIATRGRSESRWSRDSSENTTRIGESRLQSYKGYKGGKTKRPDNIDREE